MSNLCVCCVCVSEYVGVRHGWPSLLAKSISQGVLVLIEYLIQHIVNNNRYNIMNHSQLRKVTAPLTPNLEDYKQKNKSKSKRKQNLLQPTNPPTPKTYKAHIHLKPTNDKLNDPNNNKDEYIFCPLHPDKIATHFIQSNTTRKFCKKCYCLNKESEEYDPEIQQQKRRELQQFKKKIMGFGLKLQEAQKYNRDCFERSEHNFFAQKEYIKQSFASIKSLMQEKEKQMTNMLIQGQNKIKTMHSKNDGEIDDIKKSIDRYLADIDLNYHDIIQSLSYEQFNEIIERYNQKLSYFQDKIQSVASDISLSAYIPRKDIEKCIDKSSVQIYPIILSDETVLKQKTLQRYPTQKNNILGDYQLPNKNHQFYSQQHNESLHNKINQARQSRDRYEYCNQHLMNKKVHTNKENNFNMDNIYH